MRHPRAVFAVLATLCHLWVSLPGSAAEAPRWLSACNEPGLPPDVLCGTYEVFENRTARTGRKIPLHVVVIPATGPDRLPDPFVYFAGGPGEPSVPWGFFWAGQLPGLRSKRDTLLIDLRGTGRSGELACPELRGEQSLQGFLDDFLPVDKVAACRDRLKKEVDLSWYTSDAAVDDVEEVRTALGYGPVNLMGSSHGTRIVLTYLRRHPRSVRTATMDGVLPTDVQFLLTMPRNAQNALDGLIAECEGDPACRGAFPKLREEAEAVLRRATADPARVGLTDPETGQTYELRLTRAAVAQTLRYMLYSPGDTARLPLEIHLAAQGDWKPLALSARYNGGMGGSAEAFYQSVTCAEDVAFVEEEEIAAAAAGTFLGDFRIRRQQAACKGWPMRDLGSDLRAPVVSDVPALLISGERDPATPASNGARVARTLERSRHLVVPDGTHSLDGMEGADCVPQLIDAFIEAGTVDGLDTSCIERIRRPDFVLSFGDPEVVAAQADLEPLQGSYMNQERGIKAVVDLLGGRLRFGFEGQPRYLLIPTSPTRFRVEGLPPGHKVAFQVIDGRAAEVTLSQPGRPDLVMARQLRLSLAPCRLPGVSDEARCGTWEVFENRDSQAGRKIALNVAVLPATGPGRLPDPIVFFDGGPGEPSVSDAAWHEENLKPLRRQRDILLIDARGTGASNPLACKESDADRLQGYLNDFLPVDQVRACRDLLQRRADLSQYTTARIVDDMAEISAVLGYDKVNLMGTSYGTRAVLVFLRRHPERVRTATILGVLPTDARIPIATARMAQRSFDELVTDCASEPACAGAFPGLHEDLMTVLKQVEKTPVPVEIIDPDTEKKVSLTLTREGVAQTVRYMLYGDFGRVRLPLALRRAAGGDFSLLGEMAWTFGSTATGGTRGLYLSVTCAEDVAFIRDEEIPAAVAGTFLGDFRIRRQIVACQEWPAAKLGPEILAPVVSDVPVLALSGKHDPATPRENGERVIGHLKNGRFLVVPHRAHGVVGTEGSACVVGVIDQFLDAGSAETLDAACLDRIPPLRFALTP